MKMLATPPKTLQPILDAHASKIESYDRDEYGHWVILQPRFEKSRGGVIIHERTIADLKAVLGEIK